ncbi:DUF1428 family protein [Shigella sonnei]|nr:DUF1428 family protein [Shigella sonnei]EGE4396830.1 hypothetical protein [Shigella sonnei]HCL9349379.1 DUF1428 family protein [Escherichia coli]
MKYVDGFVVAVPADKKDAYREMAAKAAPLFKEFGESMPFDGKRMIYGGFESIIDE